MENRMSPTAEKFLNSISDADKDEIYRFLWAKHVHEDVIGWAKNMGVVLTEGDVDEIVYRYVYEGDYDCELSYWNNIEALINERLRLSVLD